MDSPSPPAPKVPPRLCGDTHPWISIGRRRWTVVAIVTTVYLLAFSPHWWIGKDSSLYLTLARNLNDGLGYTVNGTPHTVVPPSFSLMLAGLMRAGLDSFAALNAAMLLSGLAAAWLCYVVLKMLTNADTAILLTVVIALSREYVQRSGEILSDMPATVLILGAMVCALKAVRQPTNWGLWTGAILLTLASLTVRAAFAPLAVGVGLGAFLTVPTGRRRAAFVSLCALAIGMAVLGWLWFSYVKSQPPGPTGYNIAVVSDTSYLIRIPQSFLFASGQLARFFTGQRPSAWLAVVLFVVPIIVGMVRRIRRGQWFATMAVLCYVGGLILVTPKPRTRYLIPIAALLLLLFCEGMAAIVTAIASRTKRFAPTADSAGDKLCRLQTVVGLSLLGIFLAMNLALVGRLIVNKRQSDFATAQQKGRYAYYPAVLDVLETRPAGAVLASRPLGYLTGRQASPLSDCPTTVEGVRAFLADMRIAYIVLDTNEHSDYYNPALAAVAASDGERIGDGIEHTYKKRTATVETYQLRP